MMLKITKLTIQKSSFFSFRFLPTINEYRNAKIQKTNHLIQHLIFYLSIVLDDAVRTSIGRTIAYSRSIDTQTKT